MFYVWWTKNHKTLINPALLHTRLSQWADKWLMKIGSKNIPHFRALALHLFPRISTEQNLITASNSAPTEAHYDPPMQVPSPRLTQLTMAQHKQLRPTKQPIRSRIREQNTMNYAAIVVACTTAFRNSLLFRLKWDRCQLKCLWQPNAATWPPSTAGASRSFVSVMQRIEPTTIRQRWWRETEKICKNNEHVVGCSSWESLFPTMDAERCGFQIHWSASATNRISWYSENSSLCNVLCFVSIDFMND